VIAVKESLEDQIAYQHQLHYGSPPDSKDEEKNEDMTRSEHLQWCKQRAIEYIDAGDLQQAFASMVSDLNKHTETAGHPAIELGTMQLMSGFLSTPDAMKKFIEGFN
jgi:hypothetical protein